MAITSKLAGLALLLPGLVGAAAVPVCNSIDVCGYSITASGIDAGDNPPTEDVATTWNLMFTFAGPEMFNAGGGTLLSWTVTGGPADGWTYDNGASGLTSYGSDGAAAVTFDDTNPDGYGIASVTYTFYGTDAFWSTLGAQQFGATNDPGATSGAFFTFNTGGDPLCNNCTFNAFVAPEPSSWTLLAAAGALLALLFRKRQKQIEA
jgi:PEP-CTERM motif